MIKSHAELEQWHYKAIRENPDYRLQLQLEEARLQNEPSNASLYGEETLPEERIVRETHYIENLTDGQFLKLQALVHDLQDRLNRFIDKKKKYIIYNIQ